MAGRSIDGSSKPVLLTCIPQKGGLFDPDIHSQMIRPHPQILLNCFLRRTALTVPSPCTIQHARCRNRVSCTTFTWLSTVRSLLCILRRNSTIPVVRAVKEQCLATIRQFSQEVPRLLYCLMFCRTELRIG